MRRKKIKKQTKEHYLSNRKLCEIAQGKADVIKAKIVSPADVVTAEWVRLKCQFGCDGFGGCLVCPPYSPTAEQMRKVLDCYKRAILIHFNSFAKVKATVVEIEREIFLAGAWKAFGLGAGPCYFCRNCPVEKGICRHSEKARPSMEACGIDVYTTARKAGFPIEVVRTHHQCPNYYGLILVD
jgi:predicted metal-binding protein